ncbi:unnamed protein product [Tilletia controversa]|nr:unnamed protein product [Tilletia controversa]
MLSQPELSQRKPGSAAVNKETNGVTTPFHAKGHEFGSTAEADADALLAALKGRGDRCSNITLLGLLANIPLSTSEGLAGVYCNLTATKQGRTLAIRQRQRQRHGLSRALIDHVSAAGAEADVFLAALKDRSDRGSKSPSSVTAHSHAQGNSAAVNKETNGVTTYDHYDRSHEHLHSQPHTRSHLHLLNPFAVHSHAKGHEFGSTAEADADADALLAALKGRGHRGFNITLLGLLANIPLSTSKDLTGVYLNSAATVTAPASEDEDEDEDGDVDGANDGDGCAQQTCFY